MIPMIASYPPVSPIEEDLDPRALKRVLFQGGRSSKTSLRVRCFLPARRILERFSRLKPEMINRPSGFVIFFKLKASESSTDALKNPINFYDEDLKSILCFFLFAVGAFPQNGKAIKITLDLRDAPRKMLHARLSIPVQPGPLTLEYPQWIPGEHSPTGPDRQLCGSRDFGERSNSGLAARRRQHVRLSPHRA